MDKEKVLNILLEKCNTVKQKFYINRYVNYLEACEKRNRLKLIGKFEKHHICPKSKTMFPQYKSFKHNPWNKIILTLKQHYNAHYLLAKAFGGSMWVTLNWFKRFENLGLLSISNSKRYEEAKIKSGNFVRENSKKYWTEERKVKQSNEFKGEGNPFYNKTHNVQTKQKIKEARALQTFSEATKQKISEACAGELNGFYGKQHSEESISKMKDTLSKLTPITCPHCSKTSKSRANMYRYHFDNCKFKNNLFT